MPPQAVCRASLLMGRPIACKARVCNHFMSACGAHIFGSRGQDKLVHTTCSCLARCCPSPHRCMEDTRQGTWQGILSGQLLHTAQPTCTPRSPICPTFSPSVTQMVRTLRSGQFFRILHSTHTDQHSRRVLPSPPNHLHTHPLNSTMLVSLMMQFGRLPELTHRPAAAVQVMHSPTAPTYHMLP